MMESENDPIAAIDVDIEIIDKIIPPLRAAGVRFLGTLERMSIDCATARFLISSPLLPARPRDSQNGFLLVNLTLIQTFDGLQNIAMLTGFQIIGKVSEPDSRDET